MASVTFLAKLSFATKEAKDVRTEFMEVILGLVEKVDLVSLKIELLQRCFREEKLKLINKYLRFMFGTISRHQVS